MQLSVCLSSEAERFFAHLGKTNTKLYLIVKSHLLKLPETYKQDTFLKGPAKGLRRHRVGDYRIIYRVIHNQLLIYVIEIGHRREIYE